ncbi:MAG: hypothetical protein Q8P18_32850 [Pseudomonadota bacterium]|nr:hypothetical protein [Pseudomonadota bacterium]
MYEELSRLLAGELDAPAEATLRARIATDPALARAWADMSALPDLFGGLSFEAPPPALAARLAAITARQMTNPPTFEDTRGDPARFDQSAFDQSAFEDSAFDDRALIDPADETMDPEADAIRAPQDAPRHPGRHPMRARAIARAPSTPRGREAFLDQLLAASASPDVLNSPVLKRSGQKSAASTASGTLRRVGIPAAVAMVALAAGVVLGLHTPQAPSAPAAVAVSEGTTTVDGSVDLRAGDVRVRVDGRARVTVEPGSRAATRDAPDAATAKNVHAPITGEALAARPERTPERPAGRYPEQPPELAAGAPDSPETSAAELVREGFVAAWSAVGGNAAPTQPFELGAPSLRGGTAANTSAPSYRVTVEVERGAAHVASDGLSVALAVGESRTFDAGSLSATPAHGGGADGTPSELHDQRDIKRAVSLGAALARTAAAARADTPKAGGPLQDEERLLSVLEGVPGADRFETGLLDIDCSARPCIALLDYTGDDAAWADALGAALAKGYDAGVTLTERQVDADGGSFGLVAVSIDEGRSAGVAHAPEDERARAALDELEKDLIE